MPGSVLVFVEQREGKIHPASLQMFTAARELAGGGAIHAAIVGDGVEPAAEIAARHGADAVYVVNDPALRLYAAAPYTQAVCAAMDAKAGRAGYDEDYHEQPEPYRFAYHAISAVRKQLREVD